MEKSIITIIIATMVAGAIQTILVSSTIKEIAMEGKQEGARQVYFVSETVLREKPGSISIVENWNLFWKESEITLSENEDLINLLKEIKPRQGAPIDAIISKRIDTLYQINNALRARLETYDLNPSDWEFFKGDFYCELAELRHGLNDIMLIKSKLKKMS